MRLRNRSQAEGSTQESVIQRRLSQARQEVHHLEAYRYALVNDVLDQAVSEMRAVVLTERGVADGPAQALAESCRTVSPSERLRAALGSFDEGSKARALR